MPKPDMQTTSSSAWNVEIKPDINNDGYQYVVSKSFAPNDDMILTSRLSYDSEKEAEEEAEKIIQTLTPPPPEG